MLLKTARYPSGPLPSAILISSTITGSISKMSNSGTPVLKYFAKMFPVDFKHSSTSGSSL